jgi:hypothetical protein
MRSDVLKMEAITGTKEGQGCRDQADIQALAIHLPRREDSQGRGTVVVSVSDDVAMTETHVSDS